MKDKMAISPSLWGFLGVIIGAFITAIFTFFKTKLQISFEEKKQRIDIVKDIILEQGFSKILDYTNYCDRLLNNRNHGAYDVNQATFNEARKLDYRFKRRWKEYVKVIDKDFREAAAGNGIGTNTDVVIYHFQDELLWFQHKQQRSLDASPIRNYFWYLISILKFGPPKDLKDVIIRPDKGQRRKKSAK